jgi:hypothetical protein
MRSVNSTGTLPFPVQKIQVGRISRILKSNDIDRGFAYKLILQWGTQMNLHVRSLLSGVGGSSR